MRYALAIAALGVGLAALGLWLPPFTPAGEFESRMASMGEGQEQAYYELRDEHLTVAYSFQDYGLSLVLLGGAVTIFLRSPLRAHRAPSTKHSVWVLAVLAALTLPAAIVADLLIGLHRLEYPHWSDSLGIPLSGVPWVLGLCLGWAVLHLLFLAGGWQAGGQLRLAVRSKVSWWPLLQAGAAGALGVGLFAQGAWHYGTAFALWALYFTWLAAGRGRTNVATVTPS